MAPKFSIIVGVYNQNETLPRLIESLKNQTFRDFEVFFCDDGSSQDTEKCIWDSQPNFKWYYRSQTHKGMRLARSLNNGIRDSKGEHCVFIMADSFPELNYLEILNGFVDENTVVCGIRALLDGNKMVEMDWRVRKQIIPQHPVMLISEPWNHGTGNGLTVPGDFLRSTGGWDEDFVGYGGDDNELIARCYFAGLIVWSVPQLILYCNWHRSSASKEQNQKLFVKKLQKYAGVKK